MSLSKRANPYKKTVWYDRIVDITTGQVLQEGTRFNQKRANNIEEGVYGAYEYMIEMEALIKRLQAQLEVDGRVPGNGGSFFDTFDGTSTRLVRLVEVTDVISDAVIGNTVISVVDASKFTSMTYATIYDAHSYEHVTIQSVDIGANTITVSALTADYIKGAKVARSTTTVNTPNQTMDVAPFVTYNIELVEVV